MPSNPDGDCASENADDETEQDLQSALHYRDTSRPTITQPMETTTRITSA